MSNLVSPKKGRRRPSSFTKSVLVLSSLFFYTPPTHGCSCCSSQTQEGVEIPARRIDLPRRPNPSAASPGPGKHIYILVYCSVLGIMTFHSCLPRPTCASPSSA